MCTLAKKVTELGESAVLAAEGMSFGRIDVVILVALTLCAAIGFWSGFLWQVIRIASVIVAFWVAAHYHPVAAAWLGERLREPARNTVAYVAVFSAVLLLCYLASFFARAIIDKLKPGLADRVLGAVLGLVKGVLVCGILVLGVLAYGGEDGKLHSELDGSFVATATATCASTLWFMVPDHLKPEALRVR